jgi:PleD family two-component response regulator
VNGGVPRVLIAAPSDVVRELAAALGDSVEALGATTWTESLNRLEQEPDVIVVCYVFDELRPYRLIQHVRAEFEDQSIPIVLVRALPVRLGNAEKEVRDSYLAIGANQFLNLWAETQRHDRATALQLFRDCVSGLLPPAYRQSA